MKVKKMLSRSILSLLFLMAASQLSAQQQPNTKLGKPADWEWNLKEVSYDKDAKAVTLYSEVYTFYNFVTDDLRMETNVKKRYKILKEDGKDAADQEIFIHSFEDSRSAGETLTNIKVFTYNKVNGKIEKVKTERNQFNEERVNKSITVTKIKPVQVKVGSIVEVSYTILNNSVYNIRPWYAQNNYPTLYTTLDITIPEWFRHHVEQTGMDQIKEVLKPVNVNFIVYGRSENTNGTNYIFTGENLPGLKKDQFVFQVSDFSDQVNFEINGLHIPGQVYQDFSAKWKDIDEMLKKSDDFGQRLHRPNPMKKEMEAKGIFAMTDNMKKLEAIMTLVADTYKWDGSYSLGARGMTAIKKDGTGSNADLNFIILNMLKDAKIDAFPVVMSTRKHGRLPLTHPSYDELNTFVIGVHINDSTVKYVDASMKKMLTLPYNLLVERAHAIDGKDGFMVDLSKEGTGSENITYTAKMSADGKMSGSMMHLYANNDAVSDDDAYTDAKDEKEYVSKLSKDIHGTVTDFSRQKKEGFNPTIINRFTLEKQNNCTPDHIYLQPNVCSPISKQVFKETTRLLPVEFNYTESFNYRAQAEIPEGYEIEEMPKSVKLTNGNGLEYTVRYGHAGNKVTVFAKFKNTRLLYANQEYEVLKNLVDGMLSHSKDVIVLKKSSDVAAK